MVSESEYEHDSWVMSGWALPLPFPVPTPEQEGAGRAWGETLATGDTVPGQTGPSQSWSSGKEGAQNAVKTPLLPLHEQSILLKMNREEARA